MNRSIEELVRPNIRSLTPYRSARQDHARGILLDANENSFGSVVGLDSLPLNRYPDPFQLQLRARLAALNDVSRENIFAGVGSDEIIDLLMRIFCNPSEDSILVIEPTYGMYRVSAAINGIETIGSLLTQDFQINIPDVLSKSNRAKLIFCCSPNNPTSNLLHSDDIRELCAGTDAMIVVDEAYIDFAEAPSMVPSTGDFPNLILLRTLSKAWGLAAIRLGYCVADPAVVAYLKKIKPPYNVNALTSHLALQALERAPQMNEAVQAILRERTKLANALKLNRHVQKVFPSDSNFVLIRFFNAKSIYERLASRGIIVRDRSAEPMLENCLRITVGTPDQNDALMRVLGELEP